MLHLLSLSGIPSPSSPITQAETPCKCIDQLLSHPRFASKTSDYPSTSLLRVSSGSRISSPVTIIYSSPSSLDPLYLFGYLEDSVCIGVGKCWSGGKGADCSWSRHILCLDAKSGLLLAAIQLEICIDGRELDWLDLGAVFWCGWLRCATRCSGIAGRERWKDVVDEFCN